MSIYARARAIVVVYIRWRQFLRELSYIIVWYVTTADINYVYKLQTRLKWKVARYNNNNSFSQYSSDFPECLWNKKKKETKTVWKSTSETNMWNDYCAFQYFNLPFKYRRRFFFFRSERAKKNRTLLTFILNATRGHFQQLRTLIF